MGLFDAVRSLFGRGDRSGDGDAAGASGADGDAAGPDDDGAAPATVFADDREDLRAEAEDFAGFWSEFDLDYTPGSVARLDEVFDARADADSVMQVETGDGGTGEFSPVASGAAAYFGETLVRNYDAEWTREGDPEWAVRVGDGAVVDVFGTAHRGLDTEPPFVASHDAVLAEAGLDGDPVDPGGTPPDDSPDDTPDDSPHDPPGDPPHDAGEGPDGEDPDGEDRPDRPSGD